MILVPDFQPGFTFIVKTWRLFCFSDLIIQDTIHEQLPFPPFLRFHLPRQLFARFSSSSLLLCRCRPSWWWCWIMSALLCRVFMLLKVPDIEVVFNRRILLFLTRLWPNIEWLWPKECFYSCNWSTYIKGADPPVRSFPIEHIAIEVGTKVVTGPESENQDYDLTYIWSILTPLKRWKCP